MAILTDDKENGSKKIPRTRVCYASDEKHAEKLISLLRDAGIDAVRQGGVSDIYMAHSKMGEEIMVKTEDVEKAREVLAEFDQTAAGTAGSSDGDEADRNAKNGKKRMVLSLIITLALFAALLMLRGILYG